MAGHVEQTPLFKYEPVLQAVQLELTELEQITLVQFVLGVQVLHTKPLK